MSWFRSGGSAKDDAANSGLSPEQASRFNENRKTLAELQVELQRSHKELKMLNVLQKEYALDVIEFARWKDEVFHRRTLLGILQFYIGRIVAITFIFKLAISAKNVVEPDYKTQSIGRVTSFVV